MKKVTFTMSVIYDEEEIHSGNALYAIEHEMFNVEGVKEWVSEEHENIEVDYDEEDE